MGTKFWIKRFFMVLLAAFVLISAAQMLKGHEFGYSAAQGAVWGIVAASVFTIARVFQSRRGQHCAICKDTPEMQQVRGDAGESGPSQ
jgi:hypothetical protein